MGIKDLDVSASTDVSGDQIVELDPAEAAVVWGGLVTVSCDRWVDILPGGEECDWDWGDPGPGFY